MKDNKLNVWYKNNHVGEIFYKDFLMSFKYSDEWLNNTKKFPISCSLPLSDNIYEDVAENYFSNFLPEGYNRERIESYYKIPKNNDFLLLQKIGGDCAGALKISERNDDNQNNYISVPKKDLFSLTSRHIYNQYINNIYLEQSFSLAGAQDKIGIKFHNNQFLLPVGNSPSTHILKFESKNFKHLPQNEYLTTKIAKNIFPNIPDIIFIDYLDKPITLSERFDRYENNGVIKRIHQEDFCQALAYSNNQKYEQHNGASFSDCINLIRDHSSNSITDINLLLKWQIFNFIIGNTDGHTKNLSFLYKENNEIMLAPFYDFVCVQAYEKYLGDGMALYIGNADTKSKAGIKNWNLLAEKSNIKHSLVKEVIEKYIQLIPKLFNKERKYFEDTYGKYPAFDNIENAINQNIKVINKNYFKYVNKSPDN